MSLVTFALERGWKLVKKPGFGGHEIVVAARGRRVTLGYHLGNTHALALVIEVETPDPGLPSFRITHEGVLSFVAGGFGAQDLQTGVQNFDYEYWVQSPEPAELRRVWTMKRCQLLLEHVTNAVAHATHDKVVVTVERDAFDNVTLEHATDLALGLAHAEVYGVAALRALPEATYHTGDDRGPYVVVDGPSPIELAPVRKSRKVVVTRASMQGTLPSPPPSTAKLGEATLAQDGDRVTVTWPGVEESADRLMAAVELLRALRSAPHDGVYR